MSNLKFGELRKANASRAPRWHTSEQGMLEWTIGDWFMAMAGEVGEAADEFLPLMFTAFVGKLGQLGNMAKKYRRVQEGIANKSDDPERHIHAGNAIVKMFDEIADVQIYLDLFALRLREAMNYPEDIGDHVERVFNRTSEKYGFPERLIDGKFVCLGVQRILSIVANEGEMSAETLEEDITYHSVEYQYRNGEMAGRHVLEPPLELKAGMVLVIGIKDCFPVVGYWTPGESRKDIYAKLAHELQGNPVMHMEPSDRKVGKSPLLAVPYGNKEGKSIDKQMKTQNAEFNAMSDLAEQWRQITLTPVVDDDYPIVRNGYERALKAFLFALKENGRDFP